MAQTVPTIRLHPSSHVVIPARLRSTRLPRKLLLKETGKTVLRHTYESAQQATKPAGFCVAVDDELLANEVRSFGGDVQMTSSIAASGTDRVAEVARGLEDADIIVNVQADEPEVRGEWIDQAIGQLEADRAAVMATLATPIRDRHKLRDPACVKVVFDRSGNAMYFSRSSIPHAREWADSLLNADPPHFFQHIGLYAYRREFLLDISRRPPCSLEQLERLEQLRVLHGGHTIKVVVVDEAALGIDTADDYRAFVRRVAQR